MAATKTFDTAGFSTYKGERKFRVANGRAARVKVLEKNGHTDIDLQELPHAMTKQEAEQFFGVETKRPTAKKPTAKPTAKKPTAKPTTKKSAAKPTTKKSTTVIGDDFKARRLAMIRAAAEKLEPNDDAIAAVPDEDALDNTVDNDVYDVLNIAL